MFAIYFILTVTARSVSNDKQLGNLHTYLSFVYSSRLISPMKRFRHILIVVQNGLTLFSKCCSNSGQPQNMHALGNFVLDILFMIYYDGAKRTMIPLDIQLLLEEI